MRRGLACGSTPATRTRIVIHPTPRRAERQNDFEGLALGGFVAYPDSAAITGIQSC
jgi:hypothetical protein